MKKKVLVAMSGGVDSSVSAFLLKEEGLEVFGVTMCLGIKQESASGPSCCGVQAIRDAKRVCEKIGIPHYVLDFSEDMQKKVIDDMLLEYSLGRTPNPCVCCNKHLKFGKLLEYARCMEFDCLATGHYASVEKIKNSFYLRRARDRVKDQTYFLYPLKKKYLPFIFFPLAGLTKDKVRDIAKEAHLDIADKPQSQDLCFISGREHKRDFFKRKGYLKRGKVIDKEGNYLAEHRGVVNYTIGQRPGLGIAVGYPLYVIKIDAKNNLIIVGKKEDTYAKGLLARIDNWLGNDYPKDLCVQLRHRHKPVRSKVDFIDSSKERIRIEFNHRQGSVAPGQSVVFYKDDFVYGGGIIEESF